MKKCIYCKSALDESFVLDVCERCGVGVWGQKMFQAIKEAMEGARSDGNLFQGSVTGAQPPRDIGRERQFKAPTRNL